jgi:rieske iron-sulfur protein
VGLVRSTEDPETPRPLGSWLGASTQDRRTILKVALGIGFHWPVLRVTAAAAEDPRVARPRKGDVLVVAYGERVGEVIRPHDLPEGGPQVIAFPMDPITKVVRAGSPLNQIALIRLDPSSLSEETRAQSAAGVVAYSAVCSHEGCPVSMWHKASKTLFCACHASRFDPADRARVVDGPAPRRLAMLPLEAINGGVVVAAGFTGRVGGKTQ